MSSVKRLKSKGRASTGTPQGVSQDAHISDLFHGGVNPTVYEYRKAVFAGLAPSHYVRPMRIVKQRVSAALEALQRSLAFATKAGMTFDQARAVTQRQQAEVDNQLKVYKQARAFADAGYGKGVHLAAA